MKIRWKLMPSPGKGKAKENPARARRVARKGKKATQAKVAFVDSRRFRKKMLATTDGRRLCGVVSGTVSVNLRGRVERHPRKLEKEVSKNIGGKKQKDAGLWELALKKVVERRILLCLRRAKSRI